MATNSGLPKRRSMRLSAYDYAANGIYFVTICAYQRRCLFGSVLDGKMQLNQLGRNVESIWLQIPGHYNGVALDQFVVMPNHLHAIVALSRTGVINHAPTRERSGVGAQFIAPDKPLALGGIIRGFKARCTQAWRKSSGCVDPLWQRNYYEHVVRSESPLRAIREYVVNNPAQWELDRENPAYCRDIKDGRDESRPYDGYVWLAHNKLNPELGDEF